MKKVLLMMLCVVSGVMLTACSDIDDNDNEKGDEITFEPYPKAVPSVIETVEVDGTKWAKMNVGATTIAGSPSTCFGDYYVWGESLPRYTACYVADAEHMMFKGWMEEHAKGYSSSDYPTFNESDLDSDHDPATKAWGSGWRTPTRQEYINLSKACGGNDKAKSEPLKTLTTSNLEAGIYWIPSSQIILPEYSGVSGILFVTTEDTSKRLFFPAAGSIGDKSFYGGNAMGSYWDATHYSDNSCLGYRLYFDATNVAAARGADRYFGFTVRAVVKE